MSAYRQWWSAQGLMGRWLFLRTLASVREDFPGTTPLDLYAALRARNERQRRLGRG